MTFPFKYVIIGIIKNGTETGNLSNRMQTDTDGYRGVSIMIKKHRIAVVAVSVIMSIMTIGCSSTSKEINTGAENHSDTFNALEAGNTESNTDIIDGQTSSEDGQSGIDYSQYAIEHASELFSEYDRINEEKGYGEGKSINQMLAEQYGKAYDENTEIRNDIELPEDWNFELTDKEKETVLLEISALADKNGYSNIEVLIEESNQGGNYITYIVRFDSTVYHHITMNFNDNVIISTPDSGEGAQAWSDTVASMNYIDSDWLEDTESERTSSEEAESETTETTSNEEAE